jgi:putative SOS response-associated peptidase YedK
VGLQVAGPHLFTARSEGIERAQFWKDSFLKRRCIVPADAFFEWQKVEHGKRKTKYEVVIPGREPFGIAGV